MNHCQECSLCCKLLGIQAIDKPPHVWCQHCTPGSGCRIHDQITYPADCASYVCLWRQMREEGYAISDALRPDRCKVIIDARNYQHAHNVRCDPAHPHAWRRPDIQYLLHLLVNSGSTIYLVTPSRETLLLEPPEHG